MRQNEISQRKRVVSLGSEREGVDVLRIDAYRIRGRRGDVHGKTISFRIRSCWTRLMRRKPDASGRQEVREGATMKSLPAALQDIREPIEIEIPCKSKVKKWAFDNAYTLIFLAVLCVFNIIANIIIVLAWGN